MKLVIHPRADNITHVALDGRLDTTGVEELDSRFLAETAGRQRPTIVDLSQVEFMASRGIGMLLASSKGLKKNGHKLVLLNPQPLVDSSLRTTRIDTVIPIAYDLDEAIRIARDDSASVPASRRRATYATDSAAAPSAHQRSTAPAAAIGELNLSISNEISELKMVNAAVSQFLEDRGVAKRASYAVHLAIDELVTNVMRYAYVDDDVHTIDLQLAIEGEQIALRIVDDGRPFDPRTGPSLDLHAEERQVGGLGLMLVLDMVDRLKYERADDRNRVEVRIHLTEDNDRDALPVWVVDPTSEARE